MVPHLEMNPAQINIYITPLFPHFTVHLLLLTSTIFTRGRGETK